MLASRRKLAQTVVDRMESLGSKKALQELAAYIITNRLQNQSELIIDDLERELAARGRVVANVTTARPLDGSTRAAVLDYIRKQTDATDVEMRESTDASLIGGVLIDTGTHQLDTTIATKLKRLKTL